MYVLYAFLQHHSGAINLKWDKSMRTHKHINIYTDTKLVYPSGVHGFFLASKRRRYLKPKRSEAMLARAKCALKPETTN